MKDLFNSLLLELEAGGAGGYYYAVAPSGVHVVGQLGAEQCSGVRSFFPQRPVKSRLKNI